VKIDLDINGYMFLLWQSGQLTREEAQRAVIFYQLAITLDEMIREIDNRSLSRARDVLPLSFGTELIRDFLRMTCHIAGAQDHPNCPVWQQSDESPWKTSCAPCKRPAASRAVTCALLFPSSDKKVNPKLRVPIEPSPVSEDHLKKWTSGARPFPTNRALQALRSLHQLGQLDDFTYGHDAFMVQATTGLAKNLRAIRKHLTRAWPKMIEANRIMIASWNLVDHWWESRVIEMTCDGNAIIDLETYPQAIGHDFYEMSHGLPNFKPVKLKSVQAQIEIRVTPCPLPVDPVEFHSYPQGLALRLFIRPAPTA